MPIEEGGRAMKAVVLLLAVIVAMPAAAAEPLTRTYVAPVDRVWTATEAVLKQLGWEIDSEDWKIGYITTDSRDLAAAGSKDYGVYAKGTRHRLQLPVKAARAVRTVVSVWRTVIRREANFYHDKDPCAAGAGGPDPEVQTATGA